MTSLVRSGGSRASTKGPFTVYPSFSNAALSPSALSLTVFSVATPLNFTTPNFLSGTSRITTRSSVGRGASSGLVYLDGSRNCIVTLPDAFWPPSVVITGAVIATGSGSPPVVMTGAVMAIFSDDSEEEVMTGAVMAIFSGLVFCGLPRAPM
nr:unnamed protein product [Digitaria exilis]